MKKHMSVFALLLMMGLLAFHPTSARALTVNDVVVDLACPCECPLVLSDCNMSCGLKWKDDVGKLINKGMSKKEIIDYFVAKHGEAARITPLQRIQGKIFQYTRSFGVLDWSLLWGGLIVWIVLMFFGVYMGVKRISRNKSQTT
ncbi:MAG: cytochrome c-type biogenesis protein CcmH [Mariprofundus sp.]|nr:cytochrome c-type biogenesis protein CcmH [Mariprofundus sp.]